MSLTRYQFPLTCHRSSAPKRFASLQNEVSRMFAAALPVSGSDVFGAWTPPLDLFEDENNLYVHLELPGMQKDAFRIVLHEGVLTVSGERKVERDASTPEPSAARTERFAGKFQRSVSLPTHVNRENVRASYKDGVLTVTLSKSDAAKPREIEVSLAS